MKTRSELIQLASDMARTFSERPEKSTLTNEAKKMMVMVEKHGFDHVKNVSASEQLVTIRTPDVAAAWRTLSRTLENLERSSKLDQEDFPLFLGYLSRELTYLAGTTITYSSKSAETDAGRTGRKNKVHREERRSGENKYLKQLRDIKKQLEE